MPQEREYLTLEHADGQVIDCNDLVFVSPELLPERNDLNSPVVGLFRSQSLVDFLKPFIVPRLTKGISLPNFLLCNRESASVVVAAKERMSLGSPLVGYNLIKVPSQSQINESIEDEADHGSSKYILIDIL